MNKQKDELKNRVESKQRELQARIAELKADTQQRSREEQSKLETKLDELKNYLKDGWDKVSESTASQLNKWLKN